jgi:aerobic-type carbon monoxide dehydrogenase small subunit (CoxS/CutS family)
LATKALLDKHPHPTDDQMSSAFAGLVCRCGSHSQIAAAVRIAARA